MNMKVKLNISHAPHSHQIWILSSHFGVFWKSGSRSDLATVLQEEWLKIPLATVQELYLFPRRLDAV